MALALISLAGCSSTAHGHQPGATRSINCGRYQAINGPDPGGVTAAGWSCFADAIRARTVAILHLTQSTTEGDPVFVTFTSRPDGRVDVVTDSSHDRFAGTAKQKQTCWDLDQRPAAKRLLFFKVCTTAA